MFGLVQLRIDSQSSKRRKDKKKKKKKRMRDETPEERAARKLVSFLTLKGASLL